MQLLYKKILEVRVWHDYYLNWEVLEDNDPIVDAIDTHATVGETPFETVTKIINDELEDDEELIAALESIDWISVREEIDPDSGPINIFTTFKWPENYSIANDLDFIPTPACQELMRNQQIVFRKTALGFILLAKANPVDPPTNPATFFTQAFIDDKSKFDFFVTVKNPYFFNYTNLRLITKDKPLYLFSNKNRTVINSDQYFLTNAHPEINLGDSGLYLGDIVERDDELYELNKNVLAPSTFAAEDGTLIWDDGSRYVTYDDCMPWQFPNYEYRSETNTHPGEIVTFTLKNEDNNSIDLGNTPNTGNSQSRYQAPADANLALFHTINLAEIPSGKYTMEVNRVGGLESSTFYLLNPLLRPDAFGIIELFPYATDFEFVNEQNNESVIDDKTYQIRFKNRSTVWQYFDKTGSNDPQDEERLPLTRKLTEFMIGTDVVPDPDISIIYPVKDNDGNIEKIYSKTYLNQ